MRAAPDRCQRLEARTNCQRRTSGPTRRKILREARSNGQFKLTVRKELQRGAMTRYFCSAEKSKLRSCPSRTRSESRRCIVRLIAEHVTPIFVLAVETPAPCHVRLGATILRPCETVAVCRTRLSLPYILQSTSLLPTTDKGTPDAKVG